MKSCNEMVNSLLDRRDRYVAGQKKKKALLIHAATSVGCVCLVALLGIGVWHSGIFDINKPNESVYAGGKNNTNDVFCGDYWGVEGNGNEAATNSSEGSASGGETQSSNPVGPNDICDMLGSVVVDGITYLQFSTNTETYTPDTYLGAASDFEGTYQTHLNDIAGKLYTTKESPDVLIVILENDGVVALRKLDNNHEYVNLP